MDSLNVGKLLSTFKLATIATRPRSIREGFTKKNAEKSGDSPNSIFEKKKTVFQGPHMTILGHPKHVLQLVPSIKFIVKDFNVI